MIKLQVILPAALAAVAIVLAPLGVHASESPITPAEPSATDRAAFVGLVETFATAWNAHDAHAFAAIFAPDADFTNILGDHARGRDKVEAFHAPLFAGIFKLSHLNSAIRSVRMLTPDLAEVDVDWDMIGAMTPAGVAIPRRTGLGDLVLARRSRGGWLILVMHNAEFSRAANPSPS